MEFWTFSVTSFLISFPFLVQENSWHFEPNPVHFIMKWSSLINQYNRSYVEQMYVIMICYFIYNKWILIDLCETRMCFIGKVLVFFVLRYYLLTLNFVTEKNMRMACVAWWSREGHMICYKFPWKASDEIRSETKKSLNMVIEQ